jgi:hypothetical protein
MWLLIYGMRIAGTPTHTVEELNKQFVKKFCSISDKKLREKCKEFGIPLKKGLAGRPRRDKASI